MFLLEGKWLLFALEDGPRDLCSRDILSSLMAKRIKVRLQEPCLSDKTTKDLKVSALTVRSEVTLKSYQVTGRTWKPRDLEWAPPQSLAKPELKQEDKISVP